MRTALLAAIVLQAACGVPESRTLDATPSDAAPYQSVDTVTVTATAVSTSEILLQLTPGPPYRIERDATEGELTFAPIATLPSGATTYVDHGQDGSPAQVSTTGGLNTNWSYTYQVTVLLGDEVTADPRFTPLELVVQTFVDATDLPSQDATATATVTAS